MRSAVLAIATLLLTAHARADIPVFPQRPDWDTPVPMPPEIAWLVVMTVVVVAAMIRAAMAERDR